MSDPGGAPGTGFGSAARKVLPNRLEEELKDIPRYKVGVPTKNVREVFDNSSEKAMYDELFGGLLHKSSNSANSQLKPSSSTILNRQNDLLRGGDENNPSKPKDNTLIYIKRLEQVEAEARVLRNQLAKSTLAQEELEKENSRLKKRISFFETNGDILCENRELREENESLQAELADIHKFLADYGLAWVGSESQQSRDDQITDETKMSDQDDEKTAEGVEYSRKLYEKLSAKIDILNNHLRSEPAVVKASDGSDGGIRRARLVHGGEDKDTLHCTVYYNGIMVNRGPFRHSSSKSYVAFTQDILDGYFPLEYKNIYPDGVLFDLVDKHDEIYREGGTSIDPLDNYGKAMSQNQLLNRIPKVVVKNGEVVNMHHQVKQIVPMSTDCISASSSTMHLGTVKSPIILDTPASRDECNASDIAVIQVRLSTGKASGHHVLQLKMYSDDTVEQLAEHICNHYKKEFDEESKNAEDHNGNGMVRGIAPQQLELRTSYPARKLGLKETMEESGLVPNGSINARVLL